MILGTTGKLEDQVVLCLAAHGVMSAAEIHEKVRSKTGRGTVQAIHQELRKLVKMNIVFKLHHRYALRMRWVIELIDLAQQMFDRLTQPESVAFSLPEPDCAREWSFSTLHHCVSFYTQLGFVLLAQSGTKRMFESSPHVWYHFAHPHEEEKFLSSLKRFSAKYYFAIRNDTPLSRSYSRLAGLETILSFGQCPLRQSLHEAYIIAIDDFVSTLRLPPALRRKLEALFQSTAKPEQLPYGQLNAIFHEKHSIRLRLERNVAKAEVLQRAFRRFFGTRS